MRLWHDDIRLPPEGWIWARTNAAAKAVLSQASQGIRPPITECSLDHDLGLENMDPYADILDQNEDILIAKPSPETGLDLVHWMIANGCVPAKVTIHSWNPIGAANMAAALNRHGYDCFISPYKTKGV